MRVKRGQDLEALFKSSTLSFSLAFDIGSEHHYLGPFLFKVQTLGGACQVPTHKYLQNILGN
jgi:hypothetical protein